MKQGSFAAVARERGMDPSSISRLISGLEKQLGIRLFQRTSRKLSPTEAGEEYFNRIEPLVEELIQAFNAAKDASGQPTGKLRITTSVSFGIKCIVPLLANFESLYPDLSVDLMLTDRIVDLLSERVDLAVRLGLENDKTLVSQHLTKVRYKICASSKYLKQVGNIRTPGDIERCECLCFPFPGFRDKWLFRNSSGKEEMVPIYGRTIISNAIALQQCAIAGMGLTLLPDWLVDENLENGVLINVLPDYEITATDFNTSVWLIYPSHTYVPLKVKVFSDFLTKSI